MAEDHVVIVGGGFTGTLLAINLLRHGGPAVTLIERHPRTARGVAFATVYPEHLLNVRAANMSALPDDSDHFQRWLEQSGLGGKESFAPRQVYGDYLDVMLEAALARADGRMRVVQGEAVDVVPGANGMVVALRNGHGFTADAVALAPGNLPPLMPPGLDRSALPSGCYVDDPWKGDLSLGLDADDTVLVLGTGLTMIDVALLLDSSGFAGRVVALSRRGLVPNAHATIAPFRPRQERPPLIPSALLRDVRSRAGEVGWRAAVDELRPFTQGLWRAMELPDRRRFLRHLRAYWDVHRHRIAPAVALRLATMQAEGRLTILAGRVRAITVENGSARITYQPRGDTAEHYLLAERIVNATGPQGDLLRSTEPLLRAMTQRGLLRPDPLHIGIDVDQNSRRSTRPACPPLACSSSAPRPAEPSGRSSPFPT